MAQNLKIKVTRLYLSKKSNFRGDLISRKSDFNKFRGDLISRKFMFKIFAGIKIRGFRGHLTREIKSTRNLIPVKINPFKVHQ